jgi:O-methyltransferase involved in polyketide biosynthesis
MQEAEATGRPGATRRAEDATEYEVAIHGRRWLAFHGGFFSDPEVARPLVEEVCRCVASARPDVVVDLGGGTGFLLAQVRARRPELAVLDLDTCPIQLAEAARAGMATVRASVTEFSREETAAGDRRVMYIMRSVLHYLGEAGLARALRHVRQQARAGEFFVHQTACFESAREADCFNALYRMMGTNKWYPTAERVRRSAEEEGWRVRSVTAVPSLRLTAHDLATRYRLDAETVGRIRERLGADYPDVRDVFHPTRTSFVAHLKYEVFECQADEGAW